MTQGDRTKPIVVPPLELNQTKPMRGWDGAGSLPSGGACCRITGDAVTASAHGSALLLGNAERRRVLTLPGRTRLRGRSSGIAR